MRSPMLLLAIPLFAACVQAPNEGQTQADSLTHNRLAVNRLAVNRLAVNKLGADKLATAKLSDGTLELNSTSAADLLATSDGREVLTYVVSCALPSTVTLTAPDGTQFFGEIGVAPRWQDHQLDLDAQEWESACLFARVNANDVAVPISIRGTNPALATTPQEVAEWTVQEGAFYGQFFTPASEPIMWVACQGNDVAGAVAAERDCAAPDPANPGYTLCGFIDAGACYSGVSEHHRFFDGRSACLFYVGNNFYDGCLATPEAFPFERAHPNEGDQGHRTGWGDLGFFTQVITTYIHP